MNDIEKVRYAYNYDPLTGLFTWRNPRSWRAKVGDIAGIIGDKGYMRITLFGKAVMAHRAAWMHYYGEVPNGVIDHINGVRDDNRIENLRVVDIAENCWNRKNKKEVTGAFPSGRGKVKKWTALIRHRGKRLYLGLFKTKEEAGKAYQEAAKRLRGKFHE